MMQTCLLFGLREDSMLKVKCPGDGVGCDISRENDEKRCNVKINTFIGNISIRLKEKNVQIEDGN